MDKLKTKQIWQSMDLPTPSYRVIDNVQDCAQALKELGLPLIVKPVLEGSSIGMSKVEKEDEMIAAWEKAKQCQGTVIAERWIEGEEYTAAILDEKVLPFIKLETSQMILNISVLVDYPRQTKKNIQKSRCRLLMLLMLLVGDVLISWWMQKARYG